MWECGGAIDRVTGSSVSADTPTKIYIIHQSKHMIFSLFVAQSQTTFMCIMQFLVFIHMLKWLSIMALMI